MAELRRLGNKPIRNPSDMRYARWQVGHGRTHEALAAELGVDDWSIQSWLKRPEERILEARQTWLDHEAVAELQQQEQLGATALQQRARDALGLIVSHAQAYIYATPGYREASRQRCAAMREAPAARLCQALLNCWKRCNDPKDPGFPRYGGRGIEYRLTEGKPGIDDARRLLPEFVRRGWKPELHVDRIDNHGHYDWDNIQFVSCAENNRNKRNNTWVRFDGGEPMVFTDACKVAGVNVGTAYSRRSRNPDWPASKVIGPGWHYCTQDGEPCDPPPIHPQRKKGAPYQ